ncbi:MAG: hypothetical protein ACXVA2_24835 [Mucilaginibacter sp.]
MDEEPDQLPLARMMTIGRSSFWIYFMACTILFTFGLFKPHQPLTGWRVPSLIAICIFVALLLELISQRMKNEKAARLLTTICYVFEAASVIVFVFITFSK